MARLPLCLALVVALAACSDREEEQVVQEIIAGQDSIIRLQRDQLDSLQAMLAALNRARDVAADSALAQPDTTGVAPASGAWPDPSALAYAPYRNERYGYAVDVPTDLFRPAEAIGDGQGQAFVTDDGSATLLVVATEAGPDALRREYEAELERFDQEVTYRVLRPSWFVVSGYQGPFIFYQRTHQSADGGLRTFRLRHRAADKDYFGPITERLSYSFEG